MSASSLLRPTSVPAEISQVTVTAAGSPTPHIPPLSVPTVLAPGGNPTNAVNAAGERLNKQRQQRKVPKQPDRPLRSLYYLTL